MKRIPFHPYLLAVVPLLALYKNNVQEVAPVDLIRPVLASLLIPAILITVACMTRRRPHRVSLVASLLIVAIYAYPFLFNGINALGLSAVAGQHGPVMVTWCGVVAVVMVAGLKCIRRRDFDLGNATAGLNAFAMALGILVVGPLAIRSGSAGGAPRLLHAPGSEAVEPDGAHLRDYWVEQALAAIQPADFHPHPDIYYIILDGYAREDVLASRFNYANREFLDWLRAKGFYIAEISHGNYAWTHLSLAATFNLEYLQDLLPPGYGSEAPEEYRSRYKYFVARLADSHVRQNRVRQFLGALGYQVITADTGYAVTRQLLSGKQELLGPLTQFERTLIRKTAFWALVEAIETYSANRKIDPGTGRNAPSANRNVRLLQELPVVARAPGPKFIFYHVMAPHPPFCFDENGDIVRPHPVFETTSWLVDCQKIPGYRDFYRNRYPINIEGLNIRLKASLTALWQQTRGQAVVILQADHGSQLGMDPFDVAKADIPERFGILNAIYLPPGYAGGGFDGTVSAVNTFRLLFNELFGLDLPRLEDRAWFSIGDLDFTEVTDRL